MTPKQKQFKSGTQKHWHLTQCPFHDDHNPSLAYNETEFICLACGRKGSVDDLRKVTNLPEWEERK
ncbi:MAG: CHC2 zinc finger domain-containing protein [Chloroflexi bacterium]|nr:CHC2 zinc finger domain-containing protein [Chloroflexota bacterium]